ncbi:ATP-binding protein [Egicoccus sp. AB-alg6-2]|uniref:sensor histidine kinase n=1 Tax=Egicoccus sp. AB-alg6-2 TaxID=3242692 RepID=UPI00359E501C
MDTDSEARSVPAGVPSYVILCAVVGAAVLAAGLVYVGLPWPATSEGPWWYLLALGAVAVVLSSYGVDILGRHLEGVEGPEELILAAGLCVLRPGWAVVIALAGTVGASMLERRGRLRFGFNTAWSAAAVASAMLVYVAIGPTDAFGPLGLVAIAAAVTTFTLVNWVAIAGLRQRLGDRRPLPTVFWDGLVSHLVTGLLAGATGLVGAALLRHTPALVPLLVLPIVVQRGRLQQQEALERSRMAQHDRLERTLAGASDGIALLDVHGRIEVWNPAMAALTGTDHDAVIGRRADDVLAEAAPAGEPVQDGQTRLRSASGEIRTVRLDRTPIGGGDDPRQGVVLVGRDVTAQVELDRLRDDLVSRVAHELRTPLASVNGLLETVMVRWDGLDDHRRLELLDRAHRAGNRLTRLVSTLLTHARIERVATPVQPEPVALATTVADLLAELRPVLGSAIRAHLDPDVVAEADSGHVAQVVTGLLVNAHTYGRAPVEVEVSREDEVAVVRVRDHGDGVPPAFVPDLFTPFAQAPTGLERTAHGLGLGLSISHRLAEANGGRLSYEPAADRPGACFVLRLPLAAPVPRAAVGTVDPND